MLRNVTVSSYCMLHWKLIFKRIFIFIGTFFWRYGSYNGGSSPLFSSVLNRSSTDCTDLCFRYLFRIRVPLRPYFLYPFSSNSVSSSVQNTRLLCRCFFGGNDFCVLVWRTFLFLGLTGGGGAILALGPIVETNEGSENIRLLSVRDV